MLDCGPFMTATILDGKRLAAEVRASLRPAVAALAARGLRAGLAALETGDNPASQVYVQNKLRACDEIGVRGSHLKLPDSASEAELLARVQALNDDAGIHGILVQLPLPAHINADRVLAAVSPAKDVDGFGEKSLGALLAGRPGFVPCTPLGIMRLLEHAGVTLAGRRAVVVGRSTIVGKPLALLLLRKDATVTICHSRTAQLGNVTREADVLVAAVGRANLVTADMVRPGACVIDVGVNRLADGRLAGDVDFAAVKEIAGWITPVPGGVGPMTVAMLMANTLRAAQLSLG